MFRRKSAQIHRGSVAASATTAAAELVFDNEDLLLEILVRSPARSLGKFKSVSKRWRRLISSPRFLQQHRNTLAPAGIFMRESVLSSESSIAFDFISLSTNPPRAPFETLDFSGETEIEQSCNGLLLCNGIDCSSGVDEEHYYVLNPSTMQVAKIPPFLECSIDKRQKLLIWDFVLAFDPSRSSNYQIVCAFEQKDGYADEHEYEIEEDEHREPPVVEIKIYSSESGQWREALMDGVLDREFFTLRCGVHWNSAIHWLNDSKKCLYLDLYEDKFDVVPMPPEPDDGLIWNKRSKEYFGDGGRYLYLIESHGLDLDVWEMKDDRSGWIVKYRVHLQDVISDESVFRSLFGSFSVISMIDQWNEKTYLVVHVLEDIVRLDVKSGSFEIVTKIQAKTYYKPTPSTFLFIESLARV